MNVCTTHWEDEENNRRIELAIAYSVNGDQVEIESVAPQSITFTCPTTGEDTRRIGVHTESGRELLARHYHQRVGTDEIKQVVAEQALATSC